MLPRTITILTAIACLSLTSCETFQEHKKDPIVLFTGKTTFVDRHYLFVSHIYNSGVPKRTVHQVGKPVQPAMKSGLPQWIQDIDSELFSSTEQFIPNFARNGLEYNFHYPALPTPPSRPMSVLWPPRLDGATVKSIGAQHDSITLISLEWMQLRASEYERTEDSTAMIINDDIAEVSMHLECGYRVYDARSGILFDEFQFISRSSGNILEIKGTDKSTSNAQLVGLIEPLMKDHARNLTRILKL